MNWGVAFVLSRSDSSSTILPMENQSAALSRYSHISLPLPITVPIIEEYIPHVEHRLSDPP